MPRTIHQRVSFRASPEVLFDIFDIYLSSRKLAAATGEKAVVSRAVGARFMAYDGHLRGRNLAIVPKRLIVQSWRGANWKKRLTLAPLRRSEVSCPTCLMNPTRIGGWPPTLTRS